VIGYHHTEHALFFCITNAGGAHQMSVSETSKTIRFSMAKTIPAATQFDTNGITQACIYKSATDVFTCTNDSTQLEIL